MLSPQFKLNLAAKLVIVFFAGAGGSCSGIEKAIGRHVDIAANHSPVAMSCHRANHPQTRHYIEDVRVLCPRQLTAGQPVGYFHASPDCTHFSQAKGGQPRDKATRSLSWVVIKWAGVMQPDVITLENVKEIRKWGPLVAKRCPVTGRVVRLDGTVAKPGERVPVTEQYLIPDPKRQGQTWRRFLTELRRLGYDVDHRVLCAADYEVPQRRNRLFVIARRDGQPIVWPTPTRHEKPARGQKRWRGAHECIDFSIASRSIFDRKKPLAQATLRRVARGMDKFVLKSADPFIVPVTHTKDGDRAHDIHNPLPTITTAKGGEFMVATPVMIQAAHGEGKPNGVKRWGMGAKDARSALGTITGNGGGGHAVSTAFMVQANGGFNTTPARDLRDATSTVTTTGSQQQLATAFLTKFNTGATGSSMQEPIPTLTAGGAPKRASTGSTHGMVSASLAHLRNNCYARDLRDPLHVVSAEGQHHALVEYHLSQENEAGALRCAAFIMEYYSEGGQWSDLRMPLNTVTTKDRLALVTVWIKVDPYVVVDICLRMLTPRELANATSFPPQYVIAHGHDGRIFTKQQQVKMIGNAVPPELQYAVTAANYQDEYLERAAA